jgi:hypothetical protein
MGSKPTYEVLEKENVELKKTLAKLTADSEKYQASSFPCLLRLSNQTRNYYQQPEGGDYIIPGDASRLKVM